MKYKPSLSALLLSAAILSTPALSVAAFAHEGCGQGQHQEHQPFSPEKMKLLHNTMEKFRDDNKATFEEMHKLHEQKKTILSADKFDKAAYLSVEAKMEKNRDKLEKAKAESFASIAGQFTPEERQRIDRFAHHHHHHGDHGFNGKGPNGEHGDNHGEWHHHDSQKDGLSAPPASSDATPESAPAEPATDSAQ